MEGTEKCNETTLEAIVPVCVGWDPFGGLPKQQQFHKPYHQKTFWTETIWNPRGPGSPGDTQ